MISLNIAAADAAADDAMADADDDADADADAEYWAQNINKQTTNVTAKLTQLCLLTIEKEKEVIKRKEKIINENKKSKLIDSDN